MMDASLFILLPTGDEVIGLPLTEEGLRDLVAPLMSVKKYARQNGINLRIFFDKDNVKRFKTDVGGVVDKAAYLSKASVILRNFVSSNSTDVQKNAILEGNYNYIRWDTIECMAHQDVALVVKSAFESPGAPCVLSLSPGIPTDYKQVTIIKDRTYDDGRPELKNIPLFFSAEECIEWMSALLDGHFSLIGNRDYRPTTMKWGKQRIYQRIEDGTTGILIFSTARIRFTMRCLMLPAFTLAKPMQKVRSWLEQQTQKSRSVRYCMGSNLCMACSHPTKLSEQRGAISLACTKSKKDD